MQVAVRLLGGHRRAAGSAEDVTRAILKPALQGVTASQAIRDGDHVAIVLIVGGLT